jgi:hypothetical protein
MPKFSRCASPQACTLMSVVGVCARSHAIGAAAPRKYANGDAAMRPYRIGTRSATRVLAYCSRSVIGSGRSGGGSHWAWLERGTCSRCCSPRCRHSTGVSSSCGGASTPETSWSCRHPPGTATHWPAVLSREWSASQTDQGLIVNAVSRKHSGEVGIVDSRAMRPEIVHCASRYSRHSSKVDITAVAGQLTTPSSPGGPKPVEVGSITQQQIVKIERTRRRALRIPDALLYFGYGGAGVGRCSRPSVLAEADLESAQPGCYCIGLRDTSAPPVLPTPLNRD